MLENQRDGLKSLQQDKSGVGMARIKHVCANRGKDCKSVTVVSCGCVKVLHLWLLLGSFVPFKNVAEMQCLESGILQTAGGIVTATVKRSIMLSIAEKEAPCSCSQDKRGFPLLNA